MNLQHAERLGQKKTLTWTLYTFLLGELVFMVLETQGDFANGIIFFIEGHANVHYLAMTSLLFAVSNFAGRRNGKEILMLEKNFFITPFKNGLVTIWIVLAYGSVVGILQETSNHTSGVFEIIRKYVLEPYLRTTLILLVPLAVYSLLCGNQIKKSKLSLRKK